MTSEAEKGLSLPTLVVMIGGIVVLGAVLVVKTIRMLVGRQRESIFDSSSSRQRSLSDDHYIS